MLDLVLRLACGSEISIRKYEESLARQCTFRKADLGAGNVIQGSALGSLTILGLYSVD
jgi:hypothetical protein